MRLFAQFARGSEQDPALGCLDSYSTVTPSIKDTYISTKRVRPAIILSPKSPAPQTGPAQLPSPRHSRTERALNGDVIGRPRHPLVGEGVASGRVDHELQRYPGIRIPTRPVDCVLRGGAAERGALHRRGTMTVCGVAQEGQMYVVRSSHAVQRSPTALGRFVQTGISA